MENTGSSAPRPKWNTESGLSVRDETGLIRTYGRGWIETIPLIQKYGEISFSVTKNKELRDKIIQKDHSKNKGRSLTVMDMFIRESEERLNKQYFKIMPYSDSSSFSSCDVCDLSGPGNVGRTSSLLYTQTLSENNQLPQKPTSPPYDEHQNGAVGGAPCCQLHQYPLPISMTTLWLHWTPTCKQQDGETVSNFLARLEKDFERHSGITAKMPNNEPHPAYSMHLPMYFMRNLDIELSEPIKATLDGEKMATLEEVVRHAEHHEKRLKQERLKKNREAQDMNFTMMQCTLNDRQQQDRNSGFPTLNPQGRGGHRGRGRGKGRGRGRGNGRWNQRGCFNCDSMDHWKDQCPELKVQKPHAD